MSRLHLFFLAVVPFVLSSCGFASTDGGVRAVDSAVGFAEGIWHGTMVPFVLLLHFVTDVDMYAYPNAGWSYDAGFFLGTFASIPIGWATTLVSLAGRFLG